ncbi:RDD family protein [Priestia flexa]|uniref:RDD family protein n=1 Tax=Priestia flexa TaxID=86664 RepID=UPI000E687AC3|nr:RDD family protein [Priestia flexa]RIV10854.1 RDD family protein [Priestia flexa]
MENNSYDKEVAGVEHSSPLEDRVVNPSVVENRYAGFWMRFWAYLLDIIVVGSINGIIVKPIFKAFDFAQVDQLFSPFWFITALTFYGYFILMTKFFGQTLGKMVFGLKVVSLNGTPLSWSVVLFREGIGRYISKMVLFIGYIIVAFLPKKQGAHDYFAETAVVHEIK